MFYFGHEVLGGNHLANTSVSMLSQLETRLTEKAKQHNLEAKMEEIIRHNVKMETVVS
jgi:hypothetical protein